MKATVIKEQTIRTVGQIRILKKADNAFLGLWATNRTGKPSWRVAGIFTDLEDALEWFDEELALLHETDTRKLQALGAIPHEEPS
jgi:hypothetical protein